MSLITLSLLESHLWEAANILRGPVDAADFKTYVFPLLFFKRIAICTTTNTAPPWKSSGETRRPPSSLKITGSKSPSAATGETCAQ